MAHIKGSEGIAFQLGNTGFYIGPREAKPNERHLKRPPVLSMWRIELGKAIEPEILAEFPSSSKAEQAIEMFIQGIGEGTAHKPLFDVGNPTPCGAARSMETPAGDIPLVCELPMEHDDPEHACQVVLPDGSQYTAKWKDEKPKRKPRHRDAPLTERGGTPLSKGLEPRSPDGGKSPTSPPPTGPAGASGIAKAEL